MTRSLFIGPAVLLVTVISAGCAGTAAAQSYGFATFSAVVNKNGGTLRSSGVLNSSHSSTGTYFINFVRAVDTCSILAGPRGGGGGQVSVAEVVGKPKQVRVRTFSRSGQLADLHFVVLVSCAS